MAAPHIKPLGWAKGHMGPINDFVYVKDPDIFLTGSEDKTVRIWTRPWGEHYRLRHTHAFGSAVTSLTYDEETRDLFVAMATGTVTQCRITADFSDIKPVVDYAAHKGRVVGCGQDHDRQLLVTVGEDRALRVHSTKSHLLLAEHVATSQPTCLLYAARVKHVFLGLTSGAILLFSVGDLTLETVHTLEGHSDKVTCFAWDGGRQRLFSAGAEGTVVVWDIGGCQGVSYDLVLHASPVQALTYVRDTEELLSLARDGLLVVWDMAADRLPAADWQESSTCQLCRRPFYWNLRQLNYNRQHHCRKCGKAICHKCCCQSIYPRGGFEEPVIMCSECWSALSPQDLASTATRHRLVGAKTVAWCAPRNCLVSVGHDNMLRLWTFEARLAVAAETNGNGTHQPPRPITPTLFGE